LDSVLTAIEARVLGSLIEKELTTPEYYPLSLNALVNACNQKSSREPVMNLTEEEVEKAVEVLRNEHLAWRRGIAGARVSKYEHNLNIKHELTLPQLAAMCVLLLRGPQTIGEIRLRTGRMHEFQSLEEVEKTLQELKVKAGGPLAAQLPLQPGRKEIRFMHCLSGAVEASGETRVLQPTPASPLQSRIEVLENSVSELRVGLEGIKKQFEEFKKAFE
jgi:hypothetical protein